MKQPDNPDEELQELKHEPWPGYPEKFFMVFVATGIWLAILLVWGLKLGIYIGH